MKAVLLAVVLAFVVLGPVQPAANDLPKPTHSLYATSPTVGTGSTQGKWRDGATPMLHSRTSTTLLKIGEMPSEQTW